MEKTCPICNKALRSDATVKTSCLLCGMGIPDPGSAVKVKDGYGTRYYCCEQCKKLNEMQYPMFQKSE